MPDIRVKICGLKTEADVAAVAASGAAYMGLVFFAKSPRNLTIPEARILALAAPIGLAKVALTVNADDAALDAIVEAMPLDMLQLHGAETPERVAEVRARYGLPVMKAVGVADEGDLAALLEYSMIQATGTAQSIGLGRPASLGTQTGPVLFQQDDPGDPASVVNGHITWLVQPGAPTIFHRRWNSAATVGVGVVWTFPRGLVIPASGAIVGWNITAAVAMDINAVIDA